MRKLSELRRVDSPDLARVSSLSRDVRLRLRLELTPNGLFAAAPPASDSSTSPVASAITAVAAEAPQDRAQRRLTDEQFRERSRAILSFEGRVGRLRYLAAIVLILVGSTAALAALPLLSMTTCSGSQADKEAFARCMDGAMGFTGVVTLAAIIPALVLYLSYVVRRVHDFNATGWFAIAVGLPVINLTLCFVPGNLIDNDYGPPPEPTGKKTMAVGVIGALLIAAVWGLQPMLQRSYAEYEVKARVFGATEDVMNATRKYVAASGTLPSSDSDLQLDVRGSRIIESVDVASSGKITIVLKLNSSLGNQIVLEPRLANGVIDWTCTEGNLPARLRPSSCKPK